jgi:hypothetical protein
MRGFLRKNFPYLAQNQKNTWSKPDHNCSELRSSRTNSIVQDLSPPVYPHTQGPIGPVLKLRQQVGIAEIESVPRDDVR